MERRRHGREFKLEAVRLVRERGVTVAQAGRDLGLHPNLPRKSDQDKLDAILCMLIALFWRTEPTGSCAMIGDLTSGYIVTPVSPQARIRLSLAAAQRGVSLA